MYTSSFTLALIAAQAYGYAVSYGGKSGYLYTFDAYYDEKTDEIVMETT